MAKEIENFDKSVFCGEIRLFWGCRLQSAGKRVREKGELPGKVQRKELPEGYLCESQTKEMQEENNNNNHL